ncbi:MAG: carbohydrate-binding protein [Micromonosporaceae bacterium]
MRSSPRLAWLLALVVGAATVVTTAAVATDTRDTGASAATATPTDPNLKVAFIGDAGVSANAKAVLNLIKNENADLVIHNGDLGYDGSPAEWESQLNSVLGSDFPYVYDVGNHDIEQSGQWADYQNRLKNRVARIPGMSCTGDLGVKSWCTYRGLWFLLSGVGTLGTGHEAYIRDNCAAANHTWKVVGWHRNQRAMQLGGKSDETGWGVYEESRRCGAVISTAHEHSYGRTRTLTNTETQTVDASCGDANKLCVGPGRSFVLYSGLGGRSIRDQERCLPTSFPYGCNQEWAKAYTSSQGAKDGALFMTFHVDGDPNLARGYFKNTAGGVVDEFTVTTGDGSSPSPTPTASPTASPTPSPTPTGSNRYEAENAVCQGTVDSDHAGYSGTGFCNTTNATGRYAEWTVNAAAAGRHTLTFRYANGTSANRPVDVTINGALAADELAFPPTGGWATWKTVTTTADLTAGVNTIRAAATTSNGAANLDYVEIAPTNGGADIIDVSTSAQLRTALASVQPGQTIRMASGTYHGSFLSQRPGTASAPITLTGPRDAVLINDGPSGTAPSCPTPTAGWDSGYGFWLANAPYWNLTGFTVAESKKGIVLDNSHHVTVDGVYVHHIEEEGVHFRRSSADGIIRNSRIERVGLVKPGFGEGVYIGSANSNWGCHGNSGGVDRSDRVQVLDNVLGPYIAAEHIDIKEGTQDGVIRGNTFNGTGLSGQNSADSWVDAKGNNYLLENNTGTFASPGTFANGYETHNAVSGYGCGNVWRGNDSDLGGVGGYAIYVSSQSSCSSNPNKVYSSNTVRNARNGLTNIPVTP